MPNRFDITFDTNWHQQCRHMCLVWFCQCYVMGFGFPPVFTTMDKKENETPLGDETKPHAEPPLLATLYPRSFSKTNSHHSIGQMKIACQPHPFHLLQRNHSRPPTSHPSQPDWISWSSLAWAPQSHTEYEKKKSLTVLFVSKLHLS